MPHDFAQLLTHDSSNSTPIKPLTSNQLANWRNSADNIAQNWLKQHSAFVAAPDSALAIPGPDGNIDYAIAGVSEHLHIWSLAAMPGLLPPGKYKITAGFSPEIMAELALGILLAQYQFAEFKKIDKGAFVLALPAHVALEPIIEKAQAIKLVRDLINKPTNAMGPVQLADTARDLAAKHGASFNEIIGDDLLAQNYPAIHAVGRASAEAPRLIELRHGQASHPQLTLIGKGVCFDTGGLDIKPYSSMKLMKKDMGGAALVLGLADLIMQNNLPVRLRVLIPAVENSIAGNAFRPQDIIATRKGLSVEIGSTDAEGRVILCDALTEAMAEKPDLVIDVATLTGAARTALGAELPALFSNRNEIAQNLQQTAMQTHDPMWQLPLWHGYDKYVNSPIADITNSPSYSFAGAITAALYLQRFVDADVNWVHIDSYAWNAEAAPGRPIGGEALTLRALFSFLQQRYAC